MPLDNALIEKFRPLKYFFAAPLKETDQFRAWKNGEGRRFESDLIAIHGRMAAYLTDIQNPQSDYTKKNLEKYEQAQKHCEELQLELKRHRDTHKNEPQKSRLYFEKQNKLLEKIQAAFLAIEAEKPNFIRMEDKYSSAIDSWYENDQPFRLLDFFAEKKVPQQILENAAQLLKPMAESYFLFIIKDTIEKAVAKINRLKKIYLYKLPMPQDPYYHVRTLIGLLEANSALIKGMVKEQLSPLLFLPVFSALDQLPGSANAGEWNISLQKKLSELLPSPSDQENLNQFIFGAVKRFDFSKVDMSNWQNIKNATEQHLQHFIKSQTTEYDYSLYFGYIAFKLQYFKHNLYKAEFAKVTRNTAIIIYNIIDAYVTSLLYIQINNPGLEKLKKIIQEKFLPEFAKYNPAQFFVGIPSTLERTLTPIVKTDDEAEVFDAKPKPAAASLGTDVEMSGSEEAPLVRSVSVSELTHEDTLPATRRDRSSSFSLSQSADFSLKRSRKDGRVELEGDSDEVKASRRVQLDPKGQPAYPRLSH